MAVVELSKRERVERTCRLETADRVPFVPAIYEHKAALIGRSPSEVCRSSELLYHSLRRELAVYDPDMLVAGIDVYNVEAEAIGCRVVYFDDSNDCPAIVEPLVARPSDLGRLRLPEPEADGRMPLYLEAAGALARELGGQMIVRGAITGPYSMAAQLAGGEPFLLATLEEPEFARKLMEFCAQATVRFGEAFVRGGVEPIIFDSRATPRLASPRVFREMIKPIYRDLVMPQLKEAGARMIPLIIGGNTTSVIDDLIETGATQLLCDHGASLERFREKCAAARVPFRANVDPVLVNRGPADAVYREALRILDACRGQPGFLLGCGVVAYDTLPEHVLAIRRAIEDRAADSADSADRSLR
jgi:uroporphyrinogen decarboxylase